MCSLYELIDNYYWLYFSVESKKCVLPSKLYLLKWYEWKSGKQLNLKNPRDISEKLQWYKLYYHDPLFTICADKYRMREYVKLRIGDGYTPKLLGKWDRAADIDFSALPDRFVLKTNHDGGPIICPNKAKFDCEQARKLLASKLQDDQWAAGREWAYKNIKRCIIAEELLGDGNAFLIDYKFNCFNGIPKFVQVQSEHKDPKSEFAIDYYDLDYIHLPFKHNVHYPATTMPPKPDNLDEMIEVAHTLSSYGEGIPFVRVDLYSVNGKVYVGELTFYPTNGVIDYDPPEWNRKIGNYFALPPKNGWKYQLGRDEKWIQDTLNLP